MATVFQDPNIFSDPHILFFFFRFQNFTRPPLMFVGTFGVFKYYFQSRSCFTDFTELLFQKHPENLAIFLWLI